MTSPVDTSVKYFRSEMVGAPVLYGAVGSLIGLLDACLVNGFDLKTPSSLVVAAGVATLTYSGGHSAEVDSVLLIEGVTGALVALNGEQKITFKSATELKFATAAAPGTAAGTITFKMAPCGWTKVFTGTNKAVYKSSDPMANGHFLRVDDTVALETRVTGYETMSDIDTGTGPFPTTSQLSVAGATNPAWGGYWSKGVASNTTNGIGWTFFGDTRLFMYGPKTYQSQLTMADATRENFGQTHLRGFGDPISLRPSGDVYGTTLACSASTNHASGGSQGSFSLGLDGETGSLYTPRNWAGLGTSTMHNNRSFSMPNTVDTLSGATTYLGEFPSQIDGGLRLSERYMHKSLISGNADYAPRAVLPGILYVPQGKVFASLPPKTVIKGTGKWLNRSLVAVGVGSFSTDTQSGPDSSGITFMDITGPWR
jgi:hypothetical protein